MKKVFLIIPPGVECDLPPLGLLYIASTIRFYCDVKVIDCGVLDIDFNKLKRIIQGKKPDLVGVIATSPRAFYAFETLKIAKQVDKAIKTLIGGPHASAVPSIIEHDYIDFLVKGEGELTVKELIVNLDKPSNYKKIKGLYFKKNDKVVANKPRSLIKVLDTLPFPARDLVPIRKYTGCIMPLSLPETNIIGSRGCPFRCSYCFKGTFGCTSRFRNPTKVVDEIEEVVEKYNVRTINFFDDELNVNRKFIDKLADEIIKRGLDNIRYKGQFRANKQFIDLKLLKKLKKAGFYLICYGIESGNQDVLNKNRRAITLEEIRRAICLTKKAKIRTLGFFMMGILGETSDSLEDTIQFAKSLPLDYAQVSIAMPYPGTEFYDVAKKNDWLDIESKDEKHLNYRIITLTNRPDLAESDLQNKFRRFYFKFFFRPSYILKTFVRTFSSYEDFKLAFKGVGWVFDALRFTTKIEKVNKNGKDI